MPECPSGAAAAIFGIERLEWTAKRFGPIALRQLFQIVEIAGAPDGALVGLQLFNRVGVE